MPLTWHPSQAAFPGSNNLHGRLARQGKGRQALLPPFGAILPAPRYSSCAGAQITEGAGKILVLAVGEQSDWGRTMALVVGEPEDTPLQEKLGGLAAAISKAGLAVAAISFVVLMTRWAASHSFIQPMQLLSAASHRPCNTLGC
jgi:hypothetical protein